MRIRLLATALALAAATVPLQGQRVREVPKRPVVWAGADTNSAAVYFNHGVQNLESRPQEAAAAFYWAARLHPGRADALYGRRVALLLSDRRRLVRYMNGDRGTIRSAEIQAIDSLQLRARMLDPFLHQMFDRQMLTAYVRADVEQNVQRYTGSPDPALADQIVRQWILNASPEMKAWFNYSEGKYPLALEEYERSLRRARRDDRPYQRMEVARIHFYSGSFDQALTSFTTAMEELRALDQRDLVRFYESKALLEHSVAAIHEKRGDAQAAREAYGRALQEDLAYYPAHVRMATLALAAGDTATAVSEWDLAVQIAPEEGALAYDYGVFLIKLGRVEEGLKQVERAAGLEPYFAAPRRVLAMAYDQSGMGEEALAHYRAYLERAARDDQFRSQVQARVGVLQAQLNAASAAPAQPSGEGSAPR